ncbi:hypothetical protein B4N89_20615 [Embleya scabrispora]|uniref:DUF4082 domain-containing protein n=1 Tax=Embleya scabrispora TaxID=159449 RepID=A0A1T3P1Q8_9ACTN|nr:DUF4082 domain-containing protein [Embleya scabrispora]OPC83018.1 hypothetical protein B4N89_20615 [Embleya scabrispora]
MATYRLWPATNGSPTDEATNPINLGTEIILSATGWVTALHFWRATLSELGPVSGAIYNVTTATQVTGTAVTFTLSGTGWHTATLAAPVQLSAGTRYVIVIRHTDRYAGTGGYFASGPGASGISNGIITAPAASAVTTAPVGNGRFDEAGAIAAPASTFNGGCYWGDATIADVNPGGTDYTASPGEPLGLTDLAAATQALDRGPADPLGLIDQANAVINADRAAVDPLGLTDQATAGLDRPRDIIDPLGLTDAVDATQAGARGPGDLLGLTDAPAATLDGARSAGELLGLTDTVTATLDRVLTATIVDTIGLVDAAVGATGTPPGPHHIRVGPPRTTWAAGPPTT